MLKRIGLTAIILLCGASLLGASEEKEVAASESNWPTRLGGSELVSQYEFGCAQADCAFSSYIPSGAEVTKENDFDFDNENRFSRIYTIESKKDEFRVEIYIHKLNEVTFLPWWSSQILEDRNYTVGQNAEFERKEADGNASYLFMASGIPMETASEARMKGTHGAVAISGRNGSAIMVAIIEYGGADLERGRELAARFYSNVQFTQRTEKSFAVDKVITLAPTGTKLAVRTSEEWNHGTARDKPGIAGLTSFRSPNGNTNAMVDTKITVREGDHGDYSEEAKLQFAGFVRALGVFDEEGEIRFGPYPTAEFKTRHPIYSYLGRINAKNGTPFLFRISYMKGDKEDVAVVAMTLTEGNLSNKFLAFKARASAESLELDAIKRADETMN